MWKACIKWCRRCLVLIQLSARVRETCKGPAGAAEAGMDGGIRQRQGAGDEAEGDELFVQFLLEG